MSGLRIYISAVSLLLFALTAEAAPRHSRGGIALLTGNWKPSEIDTHPSAPFTRVNGARYFCGVALLTPEVGGLALQISGWEWHQGALAERTDVNEVKLRHLAFDIKHQLITATVICPYVTYGSGVVFARTTPAGASSGFQHRGYAFNVGAGLDFSISRQWGLAAEYQYLYVDLQKKTGLTDKYSGPKVSFKLHFFF